MNCLALEQRGEALVIDCGVTFDDRGLGIDVVHASFDALRDLRIAGLFVTHGHEDHIGAIPYFLKRFDAPVFGPAYALGLLRERAAEHEVLRHASLIPVTPGVRQDVGSFVVEPIRVTHSIPDSTALAIRTDAGLVLHTGDFKFDETPPDGETFDVARFAQLGAEGVRLLLSDSTNVDAAGPTGSEEGVGAALEPIIRSAEQLVVVSMFASNVHRLRMLGEIARRTGRKIVPLGRSVETHARVARATSRSTGDEAGRPYLEWPADLVWPAERAGELPRRAILGVATGSQGERAAALARLARGEYPALDLGKGDVVILSSRVIPGKEAAVMRVVGDLLRRGVELRTWWSDRAVHVSGHAHRPEQRRMIELVSPSAIVPVHGTLHHLLRHAEVARELGVPEVCVLENGDVATLDAERITKSARTAVGRVHRFGGREIAAGVLGDRTALAANGVAHLAVPVGPGGRLAGDLKLVTRGVCDEAADRDILVDAERQARAAVEELFASARRPGAPAPTGEAVAEAARLAVRRALSRVLGFKPVTTVTLVTVQ
jgi:ribonuclease J